MFIKKKSVQFLECVFTLGTKTIQARISIDWPRADNSKRSHVVGGGGLGRGLGTYMDLFPIGKWNTFLVVCLTACNANSNFERNYVRVWGWAIICNIVGSPTLYAPLLIRNECYPTPNPSPNPRRNPSPNPTPNLSPNPIQNPNPN